MQQRQKPTPVGMINAHDIFGDDDETLNTDVIAKLRNNNIYEVYVFESKDPKKSPSTAQIKALGAQGFMAHPVIQDDLGFRDLDNETYFSYALKYEKSIQGKDAAKGVMYQYATTNMQKDRPKFYFDSKENGIEAVNAVAKAQEHALVTTEKTSSFAEFQAWQNKTKELVKDISDMKKEYKELGGSTHRKQFESLEKMANKINVDKTKTEEEKYFTMRHEAEILFDKLQKESDQKHKFSLKSIFNLNPLKKGNQNKNGFISRMNNNAAKYRGPRLLGLLLQKQYAPNKSDDKKPMERWLEPKTSEIRPLIDKGEIYSSKVDNLMTKDDLVEFNKFHNNLNQIKPNISKSISYALYKGDELDVSHAKKLWPELNQLGLSHKAIDALIKGHSKFAEQELEKKYARLDAVQSAIFAEGKEGVKGREKEHGDNKAILERIRGQAEAIQDVSKNITQEDRVKASHT